MNNGSQKKSAEEILEEMRRINATPPKPIKKRNPSQTSRTSSQKSAEEILEEMRRINATPPKPIKKRNPSQTSQTSSQKSAEEILEEMRRINATLPKPIQKRNPSQTSQVASQKKVDYSAFMPNKQNLSFDINDKVKEDGVNSKLYEILEKISNAPKTKGFWKLLGALGLTSYFVGRLIGLLVFDGVELKEDPYRIPEPYEETGNHQERDEKITEIANNNEQNSDKKDNNIEDIENKIIEVAQLEETDNDYSYAYDAANETIGEKYGVNFYYDDEVYSDSNTTSKHR